MDIAKTRELYKKTMPDDICQCDYCKNYVRQIKSTYPKMTEFLNTIGVDIEKPLETSPLEPEDGYLDYVEVHYIVMGNTAKFRKRKIDGVWVKIGNHYPCTGVTEEHFVISISPIRLKWIY